MHIIEVLLPLPFSHTFTYTSVTPLEVGRVVVVPFRSLAVVGVVWRTNAQSTLTKIKEIEAIKEYIFSKRLLEFIQRVADYNLIETGMALKMVLNVKHVFLKDYPCLKTEVQHEFSLAELNEEQQQAAEQLTKAVGVVTVLDGITGSGKTEVYLHAVSEVIKQGKQALVLLPEIVLTSQLIERFEKRFGFRALEWHSALLPKARREGWLAVYHGTAKFVVGARSALFLPFKDLGIIVVDEEHDQSYKQEEGQIYNARDMAILLAKIHNISIVLSSATPAVETAYNAKIGKYNLIKLRSRFGEGKLPEVQLVDMTKTQLPRGEWLSELLVDELGLNLEAGKQSMLFLNRRGYAPITLCGSCLHKIQCPNCNFYLVEHRSKNILQCHYCGYKDGPGKACTNCGSVEKQFAVGPGVERLEEEVLNKFPEARTAILTSDTMENRKLVTSVLDSITKGEVDIIIGTQMITKGLHFPALDLVGVVDADGSMMSGDIRALERTYQLLYQVSGRAGRESDKGKVIIQTLDPENVVLKNLISGNQSSFIEAELENRQAANMPPFSRIVLITITSKSEQLNLNVARNLAQAAPVTNEVRVLGPSPAPIFLLRNHYRHRIVVIANKAINIQKLVKQWLKSIKIHPRVKLKIDVDPYNFS